MDVDKNYITIEMKSARYKLEMELGKLLHPSMICTGSIFCRRACIF